MFHRHQVYIIRLESYFGAIAESLNHLIQNRDGQFILFIADVSIAHMMYMHSSVGRVNPYGRPGH